MHVRPSRTPAVVAAALAAALALQGCGKSSPLEPAPAGSTAPHGEASPPPNVLRVAPGPLAEPGQNLVTLPQLPQLPPVALDAWYRVGQQVVDPAVGALVEGGRCDLEVPCGATADAMEFSVSMHDPGLLDFELGPHGTTFEQPVEAAVDYSGTNADPDSPNYDGAVPAFFWYDEASGAWVEMPGVVDARNKLVRVKLEHFSRYATGSKAGW